MSYDKEEFVENVKRTVGPKEPRPCRRCKKMWTPGPWNFYDLCDDCFNEFNTQKMEGRMNGLEYFESCDEWIEAKLIEDEA